MNSHKILRRAAELVDKDRYDHTMPASYRFGGCGAIDSVVYRAMFGEFTKEQVHEAEKTFGLFRPYLNSWGFWWTNPAFCDEESHNARIIGLLMAAEMIKNPLRRRRRVHPKLKTAKK